MYEQVFAAPIVHLGGTGFLKRLDGPASIAILAEAKRRGCTTTFDLLAATAQTTAVVLPLLPHIDYFMPSIEEAQDMSGRNGPEDCADFYTCEGGRCTFGGCKADKDRAVSTRDSRSKCDMTAKTCFTPCSADVECGGTTSGAWFGQVCAKGRCENVGCDKAEDCQVFVPTGTPADCVTPPTP